MGGEEAQHQRGPGGVGPEAEAFFDHCCQLVKLMKQEGKLELLQLAEQPEIPENGVEIPPVLLPEIRKAGE